jgi:hypothetical protein
MRIVPIVPVPATPRPMPENGRPASSRAIVCAALMLAIVFLAFQIAGVLKAPPFPDCSSINDSVDGSCPL